MTRSAQCLFQAAALALTVAALALPAFAQPPAKAAANPCDVVVQSRAAGVMEITPAQAISTAPAPQIIWQPVASGPGVTLWAIYPSSALTRLAEPIGVMITFHPGDRAVPDAISVQVRGPNGRNWRFSGQTIVFANDQARVAFGQDWPYGRGVLSTIADGQSLTIAVQQNDETLMQTTFGMSNIDSRDGLLAQARARFQSAGCHAG